MPRQAHIFRGSTRLHRGWYDPETRTVELEFLDGAHVAYRMVPASVWRDLTNARSAGRYVSQVLEKYPYEKR